MNTKTMKEKLMNHNNIVTFSNENGDELVFMFSENLGKFITEFNSKFFSTSKTITTPLKKFNEMAEKHNINLNYVYSS